MKRILFFLSFLALLSAAFFPPVLFGSRNVLFGNSSCDSYAYYLWHNLGFAFWDPYIYAGTPHFGRIAMFYLPGYIFAWLPANICINSGMVLHVCLIFTFAYLYFKELTGSINAAITGALTFSFSSVVVLHVYAGHLSNIYSLPWLPLIFLCILRFHKNRRRRWLFLASLSFALQILAGHPQYSIYSLAAYASYFIFLERRRFLPSFCLFLAPALLLAGIEMLSVLDLIKGTVRTGAGYDFVSSFYFPPENLLTLVFPGIWGDLKNFFYWGKWNYWEMTLYIGILPLFLALLALLKRRNIHGYFFLFLCLGSLIAAFGDRAFIFPLLYKYVPTFNLFRGISKFIFISAFSLSALCSQGAALFEEERCGVPRRRYVYGIAVLCGVLLFFSGAALLMRSDSSLWRHTISLFFGPSSQELFSAIGGEKMQGFLSGSASCLSLYGIRLLVFTVLSAAFLLFAFRRGRRGGGNMPGVLAAAIIAVDLWAFGIYYSSAFQDTRWSGLDGAAAAFLQNDPGPYRIATDCFFNEGLPYKLESVGGNEGNMLHDFSRFLRRERDASGGFALAVNEYSRALDLLNVKYLIYPSSYKMRDAVIEPVWSNGSFTIYLNKRCLPRAWVVEEVSVEPDRETTLTRLLSGEIDPARTAVVEQGVAQRFSVPAECGIEWLRRSRDKFSLKISCGRACFLVLSEIYYPNWHAYLDGREIGILRTDYLLRGVFIPAGEHVLEMKFQFLKGFLDHNLGGRT